MAEARRGDLLFGVGVAHEADLSFALSGLEGDLWSLGRLTLAYGLAERAVLEIRGDLYRRLAIEERHPPAVPPGEVEGGTTSDVGDFRVGLAFAPLERGGWAAGGRVEVTLPTTNEARGLGTNTTDVRLGVLGSYGSGPVRLTGDVGVAILEAPTETFEQNDVLAYSAELLVRPGPQARLSLGVDGRASTRSRVPEGTEDRGELHLGAELERGLWTADLRVAVGYAERSPAWSVGGGIALRLPQRVEPEMEARRHGGERLAERRPLMSQEGEQP